MPESNLTKKALADSLKKQLMHLPFNKITITDICQECGMHRQSFYYHFRDKYELVNWIFNEEFLSFMKKNPHYNTRWSFFNEICQYFYDNRDFYRKVLMVEEQNSFSEYFSNFLQNIFYQYLKIVLEENEDLDFYIHFYTDAIISAVKRWISSENCYQPEKFISLIRSCLTVSSITPDEYVLDISSILPLHP